MDYVHVRSNLGHVAHVLKMRHYQDSLDRLQMRHHPLSDFLYIANRIYLSQPSPRLQVRFKPCLSCTLTQWGDFPSCAGQCILCESPFWYSSGADLTPEIAWYPGRATRQMP